MKEVYNSFGCEIKVRNFELKTLISIQTFKMGMHSFIIKNKYVYCLSFFLWLGCFNDKSKNRHTSTVRVCNEMLFVETYLISGNGALGGDRVSEYITDSTNFRIYVGTYDNADEGYSYKCKNDSIEIYKIAGRRENKNKIIDTRVYDLASLKSKKIFE